jgi:hypothetical protein
MACVWGAFFLLHVVVGAASPTCESGENESGHGLLQSRRSEPSKYIVVKDETQQPKPQYDGSASTPLSTSDHQSKAKHHQANFQAHMLIEQTPDGVNPSGAAASLDQTGYVAVADRCCQSEMIEFTRRHLTQLGFEVCFEPGLKGIVPYHSCEYGLQSFDKLTEDLLRDSEDECGWLRLVGECAPIPDYCPEYTHVIPFYDCGCNRTLASTFDMRDATLTYNNLGGMGPNTADPQEMRFSSPTSASYSGKPFDLVITALTSYTNGNINNNKIDGGFGQFTMQAQTETNFKFSFVQPGTNNPVVQEEIHMATYDLDGGGTDKDGVQKGGLEYVSSTNYAGYVTDPDPNIVATLLPGHTVRTQFKSAGSSVGNPSDPDTMTADQRRNAVMFFYKNVSSFEIRFGLQGGSGGRALMFSFLCALNDRCGH